MNADIKFQIEGLQYAIYICDCKRTPLKSAAYNAACDEIKLSLEAAIERLENGEEMTAYAYTQ